MTDQKTFNFYEDLLHERFIGKDFLFNDPSPYQIFPKKVRLTLVEAAPGYLVFHNKETDSYSLKEMSKYVAMKDYLEFLEKSVVSEDVKCTSGSVSNMTSILNAIDGKPFLIALFEDHHVLVSESEVLVVDPSVMEHLQNAGYEHYRLQTREFYFNEPTEKYPLLIDFMDKKNLYYYDFNDSSYIYKITEDTQNRFHKIWIDSHGLDHCEDFAVPTEIVLPFIMDRVPIRLFRKPF